MNPPQPRGAKRVITSRAELFGAVSHRYRRDHPALHQLLPEIIAVEARLKSATMINLQGKLANEAWQPVIAEICERSGLFTTRYSLNGEDKLILAGRPMPPPAPGGDQNEDNRFSYPACCVAAYHVVGAKGSNLTDGLRSLFLTEPSGQFDFRMNPFLMRTPFHLYVHTPCSLQCEATFKGATLLLDAIRARDATLHHAIVRFNRAPCFFTDVCGVAILFDGALGPMGETRTLQYRSLYYAEEPRNVVNGSRHSTPDDVDLFERIVVALRGGDALTLGRDSLQVTRGGVPVQAFERRDRLRWQLVDFSAPTA